MFVDFCGWMILNVVCVHTCVCVCVYARGQGHGGGDGMMLWQ